MGFFSGAKKSLRKYGPPDLAMPSGGIGDASYWKEGQDFLGSDKGLGSNFMKYDLKDPTKLQTGKTKYDLADPRILMSVLNPGTIGMSGLTAAYGFGRQHDIARNDRRLEKEYKPAAQREANIGAQNAAIGGFEGGSGEAYTQGMFDNVMMLLEQEKRAYRQKKNLEEQQAITSLLQLLGQAYGAGG